MNTQLESKVLDLFTEAVQYVFRTQGQTLISDSQLPLGDSPERIADMCCDMRYLEQEQFRVALLNVKNEVINVITLYQGCLDSAPIRVAEVFKAAIRENAASIVVVHNHPSGYSEPSTDDRNVVSRIKEAGALLGIDLLDSIIISKSGFVSFLQRGIL